MRDFSVTIKFEVSLIERNLKKKTNFQCMARFYDLVMAFLEAEEREREWHPSSAPQRRRRGGRHGREAPAQSRRSCRVPSAGRPVFDCRSGGEAVQGGSCTAHGVFQETTPSGIFLEMKSRRIIRTGIGESGLSA